MEDFRRIETFPSITSHTGTVFHGNGSITFHVKLQTTIRKLGDDGKYYVWPVLVRRSIGYVGEKKITEEQKLECVSDAYKEMSVTCYAILVSGVVDNNIKNLPDGDDFFVEWTSHPHELTERERVDYLMNNYAY